MERHEHLIREILAGGPGVYLVPWLPRTGKTSSMGWLPGAFPDKSEIYVAPTFGFEGDAESGALMAARRVFLAQAKLWGFAPGKAKGCRAFSEGIGPRTPDRREHALLCAERCSPDVCDREKDLLKVMNALAADAGPSVPTLPGTGAYDRGLCTQKAGWADILTHRPGVTIGTSPQGLWHATKYLGRKGFSTMAEWASKRIIIVDEAHKDDLFFHVASPEIPCYAASGRPVLPVQVKDWRDQPEIVAFALSWDLESPGPTNNAAVLLDTLVAWLSRSLDFAFALHERFESLHATNGPIAALARIDKRLVNRNPGALVARDIRKWLADTILLEPRFHAVPALPGPKGESNLTFAALLSEVASSLEAIGARPLNDAEAQAMARRLGLAHFLLTCGFTTFDQYRRFLEPFHHGFAPAKPAPSVFQPWERRDTALATFVERLLAYLDARGSTSPWVGVAECLDAARGQSIVLPRLEPGQNRQWTLKLNVLHADLDLDGLGDIGDLRTPPIRPHFGPLQKFVAAGGTLLLLSGTSQTRTELQRALGTQTPIQVIADLPDKPRPKVAIFYDDATGNERDWWENGELTASGQATLDAIRSAFPAGSEPYLVGTGLADFEGLTRWASTCGFPKDRIEYARSRASLATKWPPGAIVWLRPPRLPPDFQPALAGMGTWDPDAIPDLAEVGERHRNLRMAQELFQTSLRTADAFAASPSAVVLLGAGRELPVLQAYAQHWDIPVTWKKGPSKHSAALADRANRLCLMAQGKHPHEWMAELEAHLRTPKTKPEIGTLTGWPSHTVNRRVNELMVAGQVRRAGRAPGRNGADLWLWTDE